MGLSPYCFHGSGQMQQSSPSFHHALLVGNSVLQSSCHSEMILLRKPHKQIHKILQHPIGVQPEPLLLTNMPRRTVTSQHRSDLMGQYSSSIAPAPPPRCGMKTDLPVTPQTKQTNRQPRNKTSKASCHHTQAAQQKAVLQGFWCPVDGCSLVICLQTTTAISLPGTRSAS